MTVAQKKKIVKSKTGWKKSVKKPVKPAKKQTLKKPENSKKTLNKKKSNKKPATKKTIEKKEKPLQSKKKDKIKQTDTGKKALKKTTAKSAESLKKTHSPKRKDNVKEKNQKPSNKPVGKKQKPAGKSKSFSASLSYREKELQKLIEKEKEKKLILKDMKGRNYCVVENCDYPAIVEDHCRIHFFGLFKTIKKKKQILEQDLLKKYYDSLVTKYSSAVFDHLFKDLFSDKNFKVAMKKVLDEETDELNSEEAFSE